MAQREFYIESAGGMQRGGSVIKNRVPLESNTTKNYFDLIYPFLPNGFIILIRPGLACSCSIQYCLGIIMPNPFFSSRFPLLPTTLLSRFASLFFPSQSSPPPAMKFFFNF